MKILFVFYLSLLSFLTPVFGQTEDINTLVQKVIQQDDLLRKKESTLSYDVILTSEKLDRNNQVLKTQVIKATVPPNGEVEYVPSSTEMSDQEQHKRIKESQKTMSSINLKKLAPRFVIELRGEEAVNSIPCFILHFRPKKDQPYHKLVEKVVNQLQGDIWVDKSNYSIVRMKAKLTQYVPIAWFFAVMRDLSFDYDTSTLPNNDRVPARFEIFYDLQTPIKNIRKRETSVMNNYRIVLTPTPSQ
jgi:hypothetical protein